MLGYAFERALFISAHLFIKIVPKSRAVGTLSKIYKTFDCGTRIASKHGCIIITIEHVLARVKHF